MKGKLLVCFGTRPEWLKIKPILTQFHLNHLDSCNNIKLLFTGQHEDLLKDVSVDYKIKIDNGNNRLDQIIANCILQYPEENFEAVLVQGDTASAFACALAAYHRKQKIFYLEAGLRTYDLDNPYPEEAYRQMISRISDVNFCPTYTSSFNLRMNEKIDSECYIVGNTSLDNLIDIKNGSEYLNVVLVTLHRRENHPIMDKWFDALNSIAQKYKELQFVIPIHPNPNVTKHRHLLTNVYVEKPMDHDTMIYWLSKSKFIITDSGGIQEEGSFLNKKVIVCRKETERPEGIKTKHLYMCKDPSKLEQLVDFINENHYINNMCLFGDGHSGKRISDIIYEKLS